MVKKFLVLSFLLIFLFSCSRKENKKEENLKYVKIIEAKMEIVEEKIEVVGNLSAKYETSIVSEVPGIVEEVYVTEWVKVRKGTPLARIDTKELEVQLQAQKASLEEAKASYERAKREYERMEKLYKAGLATKQNVEDSKTFLETQKAYLDARLAQVELLETKIKKCLILSPIDGYVKERTVSKGDMAGKDPLFKIVDISILDLTLKVPSLYLKDIKIGNPVFFRTESIPDILFEGKISFINPAVDPYSDTIKVMAEVKNPENLLKAGMFVKGYIRKGEPYRAILLPKQAFLNFDLKEKKGKIFLYNDGTAHLKEIIFWGTLEDKIIVREGISEGDKVIMDGVFLLRDGDRVSAL